MKRFKSCFHALKFLIFLLVSSITLLFSIHSGFAQESTDGGDAFLEEDPVSEDAFLAEDPVEEDSFSLEDPVADEPSAAPTEEPEAPGMLDKFSFDQSLSIKAETLEVNRGFSIGDSPAIEENNLLYGTYQLGVDWKPSQHYSFHLDYSFEHKYWYDKILTEEFNNSYGTADTLYFRYRRGAHVLSIGEQKLKIGTLDSSPIDILEQTEERTGFDLAPTVYYRWGANPFSLHLYWNPIYRPTKAQQDTLDEKNDIEDNRPSTRSYSGIRMGWAFQDADVKLSVFRWFDQDSKTTSAQTVTPLRNPAPPPVLLTTKVTTTTDEESEVEFAALEMDWSFSDYVWRVETAFFQNKNVYDFTVLTEEQNQTKAQALVPYNAAEVNTLELDQVVFATTLERITADLIIMPGILYRQIQEAPKTTHIAYYENEKTTPTKNRNVDRTDYSLLVTYEFTDELKTTVKLLKTAPFDQSLFSNEWTWKTWNLKATRSESEKLHATNQELKNNSAHLSYKYEF